MGMFDLPAAPQPAASPYQLAQLSPQQGAAFLSAQSGQQAGNALGGMFRSALGMPNDQEKMNQAKAEIARLAQGKTDQVEIMQIAVAVLQKYGFTQQAIELGSKLEEIQNKRRDDVRAQEKDKTSAALQSRKIAVLERGSKENQMIEKLGQMYTELRKLEPNTPEHRALSNQIRLGEETLAKSNIQVKDAGGFLQVFVNGEPVTAVEKTVSPDTDARVKALAAKEAAKAADDASKKFPLQGQVDGKGRDLWQDKAGNIYALGADGWESVENTGGLGRDTSDRALPSNIQRMVGVNEGTLRNISALLAMLNSPAARDAVGLKAYGNRIMDSYDRWDEKGVPVRAAITNLMSQVLHARSGAAVTVQEFDRLRGFLPQPTDTPTNVISKLRGMVAAVGNETNALRAAAGGKEKSYGPAAAGVQPSGTVTFPRPGIAPQPSAPTVNVTRGPDGKLIIAR